MNAYPNTLFQSMDRDHVMSPDALKMKCSLDVLVSAIVGRLIAERLIDYAGQPGQTIEFLSCAVADTLVDMMDKVDTVEMNCFFNRKDCE